MYLLQFALRRLQRHWRINLLIASGLIITGALVAGLPAYAQFISARSLKNTVAIEPAFSRNMVVTAGPEVTTFNVALQQVLDDSLGFMILDRVEVREIEFSAYLAPDGVPGLVRLWSFNKLNQDTRVVEGRTPNHLEALTGARAMIDPQPVEAAISRSVAEATGLAIGDILFDPLESVRFEIVGILEPIDPQDERWFEDPRPFEIEVELGLNEDVITIPMLLHSRSMAEFFPNAQRSWRLLVDHERINPLLADQIRTGIENTQSGFAIYGAQLTSGIPLLLDEYQQQLQVTRVALLLLTAQALIFVFYTIGMITSFMLDRSRTEIATMASRGAQRLQLLSLFTLEGFFLAIPGAALLGPQLAGLLLQAWIRQSDVQISAALPSEAWLLAAISAMIGWVSLVLPGIALTGRGVVEHQQQRARPPQQSRWQDRNFDIFLLALSLLAYWQLSEKGSLVMRQFGDSNIADPLLLIGPSLLLIAIALLFLRFFRLLLRFLQIWFSQGRGLILPVGLARLARDPISASRVILLMSLAAGLTIFSISFRDSLDVRQEEMANYQSGAELRTGTRRTHPSEIRGMEGIQHLSPVYRLRIQGPRNNFITLLALEPATIAQVTAYPQGVGGGVTIESLANILATSLPSGNIPVIFSRSALPVDTKLQYQTNLQVVQQNLPVEVRGIIQEFPTLEGDFVIIDQRYIADLSKFVAVNLAQEEAWISLNSGAYPQILENFRYRGDVLGDAAAQLENYRANTLAEGGKRAFTLNAWILGVLSVAGFMIVHYFSGQQRVQEFSVLRAGGLNAPQLLLLLFAEGLLIMLLGLFSGTLVGIGMAQIMRPFLSQVFSTALSGALVEQIVLDWRAIGQVFAILSSFYLLAMLVSVLALIRIGIHKSLRMSVE